MTETLQQLRDLLATRSIKHGSFRLASGAMSTYYMDARLTEVCSQGAYLIGEAIYQHTSHLAFDALGGLATGAIPLTTAAVISYHHHGRSVEGFWVRDKVKEHGTQKLVEGNLQPGARVVIVDDVITQGGSSLKAIKAVQDMGCEVVLVLALVDRLQGAAQLFAANGITQFQSVFSLRDFGLEPSA